MINIGNKREFFWSDYLVDTDKTTATSRLHTPIKCETVMVHDEYWEGDGCDYYNFFNDDGIYRMYYLGWEITHAEGTRYSTSGIKVCYAESNDGIHWVKPKLGICECDGSKDNNIILDSTTNSYDNFMVFKDTNPKCPDGEKYKGIAQYSKDHALWCYTSADAIHFTPARPVTDKGMFDSLNVAFWDAENCKYLCYVRGFHDVPINADINEGIRDIRVLESTDFVNWTDPVALDFKGGEDYPLYTNCVSPYYRAPHVFIGFPTRYVERKAWNDSFDKLCGKEKRQNRMKQHPRYGLAITDCVFMSSRDGYKWDRYDEAFMRPGPEYPLNWVYGDCYPARGFVETKSQVEGMDNELSMYLNANHWIGLPTELNRYTIRIDGFASYFATYNPQILVTKPFIYEGSSLKINFSTSARGYIYIILRDDDGKELKSCELFGDSIDRSVEFENGDLSDFSGKAVTMELKMRDSDIYSFKFE